MTTLRPYASVQEAASKNSVRRMSSGVASIARMTAVTAAPVASATAASSGRHSDTPSSVRCGRRSITTATSTTISVSTSSCVMATSGAPYMMKTSATPMPTAPSAATEAMRERVATVTPVPATTSAITA